MTINKGLLSLGLSALFLINTSSQCFFWKKSTPTPVKNNVFRVNPKIALYGGLGALFTAGSVVSGGVSTFSLATFTYLLFQVENSTITREGRGLALISSLFFAALTIISSGVLAVNYKLARFFLQKTNLAIQDLKKPANKTQPFFTLSVEK